MLLFATMGDLVNSLVRLSVDALFEEDVEHAELVQRCSGVGRLFGSTFYDWYRTIDHSARAQAEFDALLQNTSDRLLYRHTK